MSTNTEMEHFSYLFDLAHQEADILSSNISNDDQIELARIRALLDAIDTAWQSPELDRANVRNLFLRKLAAQNPNHPWIRGSIVRTLGDLVQVSKDDVPALPEASYESLVKDTTLVETLLDPTQRTRAVGKALSHARVPLDLVGEFILWLNGMIAELVPPSNSNTEGLVFTRRQGGRRSDKH